MPSILFSPLITSKNNMKIFLMSVHVLGRLFNVEYYLRLGYGPYGCVNFLALFYVQ